LGPLAAGWAISAVAGFIQGLAGFGFGLAFGPAMLWAAAPRLVVVATFVLGIPINLGVALHARHAWSRVLAPIVIAGGLAGVPIGTWLLAHLPVQDLRDAIPALALVGAVGWLVARPRPVSPRAEVWLTGPVALGSGVVNGVTGMGGPILALLAATQRWDKGMARALLATFSLTTFALGLAAVVVAHVAPGATFLTAAAWLPTAIGGSWLGTRVSARIHTARFPVLLVAVVAFCAVAALFSLYASAARLQ
jgi:uncharacterized membrane protein YfcA